MDSSRKTEFKSVKSDVKGLITMDTTEIQRIIRDYYKQLYANKMGQPGKSGQILRQVQPSKTEPGRNSKQEQTKPMYLWSSNLPQKRQKYTMGKRQFLQ